MSPDDVMEDHDLGNGKHIIVFRDGSRATRDEFGNLGPRTKTIPTTPTDFPPAARTSYPGPTAPEMLIGFGVLAGLTFLLPKPYGVWIPVLVLLGYGASHTKTVNDFLTQLTSYLPQNLGG